MQTADRMFYFHGDANAVGSVLQHPEQRLIPANVSCSVPQVGGETHVTMQGFADGQTLTAGRAYTHAVGTAHPRGGWTTLVTAVLEGVNLMHVLTADRIVASNGCGTPGSWLWSTVSLVGSSFKGVRLAGSPLDMAVNSFFNSPRAIDRPGATASARGVATADSAAQDRQFTGNGDKDRLSPKTPSLLNLALQQSREITASATLPEELKKRYTWVQSDLDRTAPRALLCSVVQGIRSTTGRAAGTTVGHIVSYLALASFFLAS